MTGAVVWMLMKITAADTGWRWQKAWISPMWAVRQAASPANGAEVRVFTAAHPANDGGGGVDVDEDHRRGHRECWRKARISLMRAETAGRIPCQRGGGARLYRSAPSE